MFCVFLGSLLLCLTRGQLFGENVCNTTRTQRDRHCCANYFEYEGRCLACRNGTFGINCSEECPTGFYGYFCKSRCICSTNQICSSSVGCRTVKTESNVQHNDESNRTTSESTINEIQLTSLHKILLGIGLSTLGLLAFVLSASICITKFRRAKENNRSQALTTPNVIYGRDVHICSLATEENERSLLNTTARYELVVQTHHCESLDLISVVEQGNGGEDNVCNQDTESSMFCEKHVIPNQYQLEQKCTNDADCRCILKLSNDEKSAYLSAPENTENENDMFNNSSLQCARQENNKCVSPIFGTATCDLQKEGLDLNRKTEARRKEVYSFCHILDDDHLTQDESPYVNYE